ncbi:MAG TPA: hypothetical protein P5567_05165 [Kiritimatiellia bacterium]|nr:hypothetical protein [Kiritimatiellia bacterium]HRZ11826.1 hypothetical protein [Kiritimatiellia bacterium]HSA17368.1 hypothetical protein [Kiritimatiellia bacterium]
MKLEFHEQSMAEAWRRTPVPGPTADWMRGVMQAVRREGAPRVVPFPERASAFTWRMAWAAAAAVAVLSFILLARAPSEPQWAWQIMESGAGVTWLASNGD